MRFSSKNPPKKFYSNLSYLLHTEECPVEHSSHDIVCAGIAGMSLRVKEIIEERENANNSLSPFVFASQMKMQAFSLEIWCNI